MKREFATASRLLATGVAVAGVLACADSPTGPDTAANPDLVAEANGAGFAGSHDGLPQGSDTFTGPGGVLLDATAEEFIQQLTLTDGTVLRTSGVGVYAVPEGEAADGTIDRVSFGSALTGSLASVPPGRYDIGPWPDFDFIREVQIAHAQIRFAGQEERLVAEDGEITIASLDYFPDVYPCELAGTSLTIDLCEYQVGILQGVIAFTVTLDDGTEVVQEETEFTLPIRRRTIIARQ